MTAEYLYTHDDAYNFLLCYFLLELSDPHFWQDAAQEIEQNERMTYCRYMAAWLSHEKHYDKIIKRLMDAEKSASIFCS